MVYRQFLFVFKLLDTTANSSYPAKQPVVLTTMRKGAVAIFLWLMATVSAVSAQSGMQVSGD